MWFLRTTVLFVPLVLPAAGAAPGVIRREAQAPSTQERRQPRHSDQRKRVAPSGRWLEQGFAASLPSGGPASFATSLGEAPLEALVEALGVAQPGPELPADAGASHAACDLHIIATRHSEAAHNVAEQAAVDDAAKLAVLADPQFLDAVLSPKGERQMREAASSLQRFEGPVLVSPLRRTLQSAALASPSRGFPIRAAREEGPPEREVARWKYPGRDLVALDLLLEKQTGDRPCDMRHGSREILAEGVFPADRYASPTVLLHTDKRVDTPYALPLAPSVRGGEAALVDDREVAWLAAQALAAEDASAAADEHTLLRAKNLLTWLPHAQAALAANGFPGPVLMVGHKGFLRELELAMGLHEDRKAARKAHFKNAETRQYSRCHGTWESRRVQP